MFNTIDTDAIEGAITAAEELNSPIILGTAEVLLPQGELQLIGPAMINMAKKAKLNIYTGMLAAATALLIVFLNVSPLYILLVTGVIFTTVTTWRKRK